MNTIQNDNHPPTITQQIGNTIYEVELNFSKTSKETLESKIKRMITKDIKAAGT